MPHRRLRLLLTGVIAGFVVFAPPDANGQDAAQARTELVLSARAISIGYDSTLRADAAAHQAVLDVSAGERAEIKLGQIEGHRALSVGPLGAEPGSPPHRGPRHELWLSRTGNAWVLDARPIPDEVDPTAEEDDNPPPPREPAQIPLTHIVRPDESSDTPLVALMPFGDDRGQLALLWGDHYWYTGFEFIEIETPPRPERTSDVGRATLLTRDSDTSGRWRATRRGTRNETIVTEPTGETIEVWFQKEMGTDHRDFAGLESVADGEVVLLSGAGAIRLRSEVSLRVGETRIPTDNLVPDFPGSYSLWLKAVGEGWHLVFNNEPDSWGSQHDPAFDAAEIELTHVHGGPNTERPLQVYLVPRRPGEVGMVIHWGQHTWTTDLTIED